MALCGAGNLASTRCEEGSGLCVKHPFQVTPLDWVFPHWSPRNVTSRHNNCLTKRAVGERAVGKQACKYSLLSTHSLGLLFYYISFPPGLVLAGNLL